MHARAKIALTLLASLLVCVPVVAQQPGPAKPKPKAAKAPPAAKEQAKVVLTEELFRLETVGLAIKLPEGAQAQKSRLGEQVTGQITPAPGEPQWLLNIQTPQSSKLEFGPREVASEVLEQIRGQFGVTERIPAKRGEDHDGIRVVSSKAKVIDPVRELRLGQSSSGNAQPAARFYVQTPGSDGKLGVVRGYTVFSIRPGQFVVFDLIVPEPEFARVRPVYEAMIASAEFEDPGKLAAARGTAIQAGVGLLASLTPEDYEAVVANTKDLWFRMYKPSATGSDADAQELGYMRLRAWKGTRGDVDESGKKGEGAPGYVVRLEARQLGEGQVIDTAGTYFMSADRKEELWSLQTAVRDKQSKRVSQTLGETGARSGTSMSVSISGSTEARTNQPFVPDTGYLSQVEMLLLPQLLVRKKAQELGEGAVELGFYGYQSAFGNIRFRRDAVSIDQKRAGAVRVTTKDNEDREPYVSIFNEKAEFIQTTLSDGSVRVPVDAARLLDLWKGKGLPVD